MALHWLWRYLRNKGVWRFGSRPFGGGRCPCASTGVREMSPNGVLTCWGRVGTEMFNCATLVYPGRKCIYCQCQNNRSGRLRCSLLGWTAPRGWGSMSRWTGRLLRGSRPSAARTDVSCGWSGGYHPLWNCPITTGSAAAGPSHWSAVSSGLLMEV